MEGKKTVMKQHLFLKGNYGSSEETQSPCPLPRAQLGCGEKHGLGDADWASRCATTDEGSHADTDGEVSDPRASRTLLQTSLNCFRISVTSVLFYSLSSPKGHVC